MDSNIISAKEVGKRLIKQVQEQRAGIYRHGDAVATVDDNHIIIEDFYRDGSEYAIYLDAFLHDPLYHLHHVITKNPTTENIAKALIEAAYSTILKYQNK